MIRDKAAHAVLSKLYEAGYDAYIVGGAVRDYVLQRPFHDIDICTSATTAQLEQLFPNAMEVGIKHGTVIIPFVNSTIEVSEYRKSKEDEQASLFTDLHLRDFTCNAIAMDADGTIIDPLLGTEHIKERTLYVVESPERFLEDPLRLLRGLRLCITLDFSLHNQTNEWIKQHASLLSQPAIERIAGEIEKMVTNKITKPNVHFLLKHELLFHMPYIFPFEPMKQYLLDYKFELELEGKEEWWAILTYSPNIEETVSALTSMKRSKDVIKKVESIMKAVHKRMVTPWDDYVLYQLGKNNIISAEKIAAVLLEKRIETDILLKRYEILPIHSFHDVCISGNDIVRWFPNNQGKWVGETLKRIERKIVLRELSNNQREIYEWVKEDIE
ncbi:CCA tRNA nucleotidyltransferase [Evansella sp. AB-rgal1]|uniref:CCA tRNA nucleotidyltransferase n=1 Tax=Evansella sp. AB-rgal1 TaxID=3242696 RepID=UPI00359D2365